MSKLIQKLPRLKAQERGGTRIKGERERAAAAGQLAGVISWLVRELDKKEKEKTKKRQSQTRVEDDENVYGMKGCKLDRPAKSVL